MSKRVNNKKGKPKRSKAYGHYTRLRGGSHGDHYPEERKRFRLNRLRHL